MDTVTGTEQLRANQVVIIEATDQGRVAPIAGMLVHQPIGGGKLRFVELDVERHALDCREIPLSEFGLAPSTNGSDPTFRMRIIDPAFLFAELMESIHAYTSNKAFSSPSAKMVNHTV